MEAEARTTGVSVLLVVRIAAHASMHQHAKNVVMDIIFMLVSASLVVRQARSPMGKTVWTEGNVLIALKTAWDVQTNQHAYTVATASIYTQTVASTVVRQDILHGGEVRELLAVHVWHVSLDVIPVVMPIRALDAVQVYIY